MQQCEVEVFYYTRICAAFGRLILERWALNISLSLGFVELATHGGLAEENSLCFQKVKKIFYFKTNIYVASGSTYISSITETL